MWLDIDKHVVKFYSNIVFLWKYVQVFVYHFRKRVEEAQKVATSIAKSI
jgi:hypothetical protein